MDVVYVILLLLVKFASKIFNSPPTNNAGPEPATNSACSVISRAHAVCAILGTI